MAKRKKYTDAAKPLRPRAAARAGRGARAREVAGHRASSTRPSRSPFRLGVDPRKADQMLRGTVSLPAGTGKDVRVAVFAAGDAAAARRARPAPTSSAPTTSSTAVEGGFLDFDVAIATPDLMGQVGKLGRVLGPRGLMPNPKTGTVTTDVGKAVGEFKGGKVEYRTDRYGNVHVPIGKASFPSRERCCENYRAVLDELQRAKPASAKGRYLKGHRDVVDDGPGREDRADCRVEALAPHRNRPRRRSARGAALGHGMRVRAERQRDRRGSCASSSTAGRARSRARPGRASISTKRSASSGR